MTDTLRTDKTPKPLLSVRDLRVSFTKEGTTTRAVDGLSFDVAPGEILGVVGESGSGKSVTSLAVLRLVRPPGRIVDGSVTFEGRDLLTLPERDLQAVRGREISMISQDPTTSLNPVMTVGEQIARIIRLHVEPNPKKARRLAIDALRQVEIPSPERRLEQYPYELSGGMLQRVMIAMAMVSHPKLLIADEPTTALDVTIQSQILDLLFRLRDDHGVAIMFISHDLAVVSEIADRVLVMYAGRSMETGPVGEVLDEPHHPYTQALLQAIPHLGQNAHRQRIPIIPGQVASLTQDAPSCIFAPRCSHAWERCHGERPPVLETAQGRTTACWLHEPATDTPAAQAAPLSSVRGAS